MKAHHSQFGYMIHSASLVQIILRHKNCYRLIEVTTLTIAVTRPNCDICTLHPGATNSYTKTGIHESKRWIQQMEGQSKFNPGAVALALFYFFNCSLVN